MLSATPVNNKFNDLRNQLALAYEGDTEEFGKKLKSGRSVDLIFRRAQAAFNAWSKLPAEQRTPKAILDSLDFDFFALLDAVTIARSRRHITTFYDPKEIGEFPTRRKPLSFRCPLTHRADVIGFNDIFVRLTLLKLGVYTPVSYILPSRIAKYEALYDTEVNRHIYDYVFTYSKNERDFVGLLDTGTEVEVYAKLPRSFTIPTPVGNYAPDWAIAFKKGMVKHIYFIAETKGSMSSLELRQIEKTKIDCARVFFHKITSDNVKYEMVDGFETLMKLVQS
jgi:hypothetical protein